MLKNKKCKIIDFRKSLVDPDLFYVKILYRGRVYEEPVTCDDFKLGAYYYCLTYRKRGGRLRIALFGEVK